MIFPLSSRSIQICDFVYFRDDIKKEQIWQGCLVAIVKKLWYIGQEINLPLFLNSLNMEQFSISCFFFSVLLLIENSWWFPCPQITLKNG